MPIGGGYHGKASKSKVSDIQVEFEGNGHEFLAVHKTKGNFPPFNFLAAMRINYPFHLSVESKINSSFNSSG